MESSDGTEREKEDDEKKSPLQILTSEASADYLKSWPVTLPVPVKSIHTTTKGSRPSAKSRSYRFRYSYMKNWLIPLDGPMSMDHVHFLLDCFVVSAGPVPLQLGRYHPQSDPEEFVRKEPRPEDDAPDHEDEGDDFWTKVSRAPRHADSEEDAGPSSSSTVDWSPGDVEWDGEYITYENYFPRSTSATMRPPDPVHHHIARYPSDATSDHERRNSSGAPDDAALARELSEMRLVLERLLDARREGVEREMREVLDLLPDAVLGGELGPSPPPPFPVGERAFVECGVCLEGPRWLHRRACCGFAACASCLRRYCAAQVGGAGRVQIECCNTECGSCVHRDEISARLDDEDRETFRRLLVLANQDASTKTCPRCSHLTRLSPEREKEQRHPGSVTCPSCLLEWCFQCHAPWHSAVSCRQFRKGDRLLRSWARERSHGQLNAQKCPRCRIYIQRTTGCDHMHCTRCKTDFCYRCGERFRYLKFFGDHYSKLSIFGCKYRFKADQPLQRKLIRGAIFGGKVIAAPVVGALALCAGAAAVSVSLFALPALGGLRLYGYCKSRRRTKKKVTPPKHVSTPSAWVPSACGFRR